MTNTLRNVIHTCRAFHRSHIEAEVDFKFKSWVRLWGTDTDIERYLGSITVSIEYSFVFFHR